MSSPQVMIRRLGTFDAVVIGLGSMIGAGVFAAFTPAANAAGSGLLIGLLVAAVVAFCNATSPAQLVAAYPSSGGTYIYGRERLGPWPGYLAGWGFVIGKAASTAAMAMTFAAYAAPAGWERPVAIAAVVVLAAVNYHGVSRIATMGEEVRNPGRTIPRAIMIALAITVVRYALNVLTLLASLGPAGVAGTPTPLANAVGQGTWVGSIVGIGAAVAALGALLALIAGLGRTSLAMARERDLPHWLPAIHPRYKVPHRAETVLAGLFAR